MREAAGRGGEVENREVGRYGEEAGEGDREGEGQGKKAQVSVSHEGHDLQLNLSPDGSKLLEAIPAAKHANKRTTIK